VVPRGKDLPHHTNRDYQYEPKPAEDIPPIAEHEFSKHFYSCCKRCSNLKKTVLCYFHRCSKPCYRPRGAITRIPKKTWRFEESGPGREFVWGISGAERQSFYMIALYHLLILIPPFIFWFLWLFRWKHHGDLQNASVPFLMALGLISLFWFPVLNK
jgi:hypothetical protein